MKLATYLDDTGRERIGVVETDRIHSLPSESTMRELIDAGLDHTSALGEDALRSPGVPLDSVHLLPPLEPASVRDFVTFSEHVEGVRRSIDGIAGVADAWFDAPTFYFTNPHTILGPGAQVLFPGHSVDRDFELEVAVVVGSAGTSLDVTAARDHVFGYTIMNDWSARDLQRREMQVSLGPAKGKDFATTLGPWIVTADELDPYRDSDGFLDLWCTAEVNGKQVGRDLLSNMGWSFETMIAYASRDSRVVSGDVLGSGTTGNGGCLAELWGRNGRQDPPPLQDGDVVTLTVEGIGTLTNRVDTAGPAPILPPVRQRSAEHARSVAS